jgi:hypothetical protein
MRAATDTAKYFLSAEDWREVIRSLVAAELEPLRRRRQRRYHVYTGEVRITYNDPLDERACTRTAGLLNVSTGGMMVKTYSPMPENIPAELEVTVGEFHFFAHARLRHSSSTLGGYKVGIELLF